jgi:hypothetical protein
MDILRASNLIFGKGISKFLKPDLQVLLTMCFNAILSNGLRFNRMEGRDAL